MNRRIWLSMLVLLLVPACAHYEKDFKPEPVAQEFLPKFQLSSDVAVVGVFQDAPTEVQFMADAMNMHKWYTDDNELVSIAVMVTKDILMQNKVAVNENAPKVLKISFANSEQDMGMWSVGINFRFQVQAGDEITKEFQGSQNVVSGYQAHWAVEAAVSDAMIKVFQDPDILNYLKN